MAADCVHQISPPLQASIVSIEFDSAIIELHPRRFARIRHSFMAIASAIDADDILYVEEVVQSILPAEEVVQSILLLPEHLLSSSP
jgi:hypothetical protein